MIQIVKDQPRNNVPIHVLFGGMPRTPIHALAPPGINYGAIENSQAIIQTAGTKVNDGSSENNLAYFCGNTDPTATNNAPTNQGYQFANRGEVNGSIMCASNNREGNLAENNGAEHAIRCDAVNHEVRINCAHAPSDELTPVYCGPNANSKPGTKWMQ